jgi:hypothetical protein
MARLADGAGAVDYRSLFLVPTGMAAVAIVLLALFCRPPERGPAAVGPAGGEGALAPEPSAP